jgi:hypothetical protein
VLKSGYSKMKAQSSAKRPASKKLTAETKMGMPVARAA